jgi:hypothetical protein
MNRLIISRLSKAFAVSSLVWIDFDAAERDRAQRILGLFGEKDSRDELGLGSLRDSIADLLFPGTSTIQTRLRYMLFIPWLFDQALREASTPRAAADKARGLEITLIQALRHDPETMGVIGRDAGDSLKRMASDVYWAGLHIWGLRHATGSKTELFEAAKRLTADGGAGRIWAAGMPPRPKDLLQTASFTLRAEEADFLVDRIAASCPDSLLAELARARNAASCDQIWQHPGVDDFSARSRALVRHAELFSHLMEGAGLLYNLMLAERRAHEPWTEDYRARLDQWSREIDFGAFADWSLDTLWSETQHEAHAVRPQLQNFVTEWRCRVLDARGEVADDPGARAIIETRETRLKGARSRLRNKSALDRWGGASGVARLNFRWTVASRHLKDIADVA